MDPPPRLLPEAEYAWDAFQTLSPDRPRIGAGLGGLVSGPIPLRDVRTYAEVFGPRDADGLQDLVDLIRHMDAVYLDDEAKRLEKKQPKGKKGKK